MKVQRLVKRVPCVLDGVVALRQIRLVWLPSANTAVPARVSRSRATHKGNSRGLSETAFSCEIVFLCSCYDIRLLGSIETLFTFNRFSSLDMFSVCRLRFGFLCHLFPIGQGQVDYVPNCRSD